MPEDSTALSDIPVLTDVVELVPSPDATESGIPTDGETLIAELQTKLAVGTFGLTEQLLHSAFAEMEATLFEQVLNRLRQELPELIDTVLREHLDAELPED
jgi:hypothetical protein